MNNKIDKVLMALLNAKHTIVNTSLKEDNYKIYNEIISNLDNTMVNYTINNKMTNKEILDCALSLLENKKSNKFIEKLKAIKENIKVSKIINNVKEKIIENRKKKEIKKEYEKEIISLVKERLKNMLEEDKKIKADSEKRYNKNEPSKNIEKQIPFYTKKQAQELIKEKKPNLFIFPSDNKYLVYKRKQGPYLSEIDKNKIVDKYNIEKFDTINQAVVYAIDDQVLPEHIKQNFNTYKNNYGNLASYIVDKRDLKNDKIKNINTLQKQKGEFRI